MSAFTEKPLMLFSAPTTALVDNNNNNNNSGHAVVTDPLLVHCREKATASLAC